jgi:fermentation-respiration switch protein FrsA (DUF1100 family)
VALPGAGAGAGTDTGLPSFPAAPGSAIAFYDLPTPLPEGRPGDVIRAEDVALSAYPNARARRIMYLSRNNAGRPVAVTGLLLTPRQQGAGRANPLVVHTPGTRGFGDHCAASKQADVATASPSGSEYSYGEYQKFLLRGVSVVVTDYLGQGTAGTPEYLVGRPAGYNGLDALRAAQRLGDAGVSIDSPVGISGYSQGGHAAAWAAQLHRTYAPELKLRGVLAGGVPTDIGALVAHFSGNPTAGAGLAVAALVGLDAAHPELGLARRLTPAGRSAVARIRTGCAFEYLGGYGTLGTADVASPDVLTDPAWLAAFDRSRAGRTAPGVPAWLYHGTADTIVPFEQGRGLFREWCSRRADVTFESIPGGEHLGGVLLGPPLGIAWLIDRVDGADHRRGCRDAEAS